MPPQEGHRPQPNKYFSIRRFLRSFRFLNTSLPDSADPFIASAPAMLRHFSFLLLLFALCVLLAGCSGDKAATGEEATDAADNTPANTDTTTAPQKTEQQAEVAERAEALDIPDAEKKIVRQICACGDGMAQMIRKFNQRKDAMAAEEANELLSEIQQASQTYFDCVMKVREANPQQADDPTFAQNLEGLIKQVCPETQRLLQEFQNEQEAAAQ